MDLLKPSYATRYAKNASQSAHPNLWDGLVGAWMPSLGVTGETLRDVSGNGNHGTLTNMDAATDWVATSKGLALDFDGGSSSNYISLGASNDIYEDSLTEATWLFWIKFNSFTNYAYNQILETYAQSNNYQISCLVKSNGKLAFYLAGVGGSSFYDGTGIHTLSTGKWYQLAFVYKGGIKQDGYVDSRFDGRASGIRSSLIATTQEVLLSQSIYQGGRYIDGQYGSVIQYNRALSPTEIKQLYVDSLAPFRTKKRTVVRVPAAIPAATKVGSIKKPTTIIKPSYQSGYARNASESENPKLWDGLVGAWIPSLGVTGETLRDVSGNGNHGTLTNMDASTDWVATSKGVALDFDGSDDYVSLPVDVLSETRRFSVSFWIYASILDVPNGSADGLYDSTDDWNTSGGGMWITIDDRGGLRSFDGISMQWETTAGSKYMHASNLFSSAKEWHCVSCVYRGTSASIYHNGLDKTSSANTYQNYPYKPDTNQQPSIGKAKFAGTQCSAVIGSLIIHNRALSPQEIKQLYVDSLAPFRRKQRVSVAVPAAVPTPSATYHPLRSLAHPLEQ